jgi:acetolactate synthase-1/2/3 large subunit
MTSRSTAGTRGADIVARALAELGTRTVFTLSGNHIMPIFDALIVGPVGIVHTRHEAAAVFMADAWGRLTGEPGVAMVTGGPGHANAVGALYTALCAESPMVLLSGHAGTWELGRGGFQEIRQADMAAPVSKASWTAASAEGLGQDIGRAFDIARSGRPGPVHVSLPFDLLEARVENNAIRRADVGKAAGPVELSSAEADTALALLRGAQRPLILAGPQMASRERRALLDRLEQATGVPCVVMDAVRGVNDCTIGAFADVLARADLVLLLGKALDFTLKFGEGPAFDSACRFVVIDPEAVLVERVARAKGALMALGLVADTLPATQALMERAGAASSHHRSWRGEVGRALQYRPAAWTDVRSKTPGKLHAIEVFTALKPILDRDPATILVCDGGEFSQWGQSLVGAPRRLINSVAGAIGGGTPSAIAARVHDPKAPVFAVMGDGTFGFHMAEFDTAVRHKLSFVAIVGTDAAWNAERQIQVREYGPDRVFGCELLPTRYDEVVKALGGHGELVTAANELAPAVERALASGKPACVNVMIERIPAPVVRLPKI